jgi:deazaflavin-dependent oxidoreductase (nitroreductase family)
VPDPHIHDFNVPVVHEFRANGGHVGGPFAGGNLLLLTTVGARSGREQTSPLGYVREGERLLVVGSAGGSPHHPAWYHNVLAHPMVRVEVGAETFGAIAVPAEGAERNRLFARIVSEAPGYADYQAAVERLLPVVALQRSFAEGGPDLVTTLADKLIEIHSWLREQLRRVQFEAETYFATRARSAESTPLGLSLQIRQHCLAFCESLSFHHTGEDLTVFPELERQHPHLADAIDRLRAEHATVARIRDELGALLANVSTADPDSFRTALAGMSKKLLAHLDFEETTLIPVLAAVPFPPGRQT